ncbi:MAG: hypothetical protein AVDCRST_MAG68-3669 [uncultured Gemmatimonadetes bacterium]|uniref:Uncharacterized protein n=1 Tax=uncultured Gemmatimonadota bacterium TaxID=203437 RepID=A0A6J4M6S5_9BACT|nr:MAG: hypothetical protein AVDCRST_MAG68-3669 [uncultured Gemmatimonadota bacterium]
MTGDPRDCEPPGDRRRLRAITVHDGEHRRPAAPANVSGGRGKGW